MKSNWLMFIFRKSSNVALTASRYPNLKRGKFAVLEDSDVKVFESILGSNRVLTDDEDLTGKI